MSTHNMAATSLCTTGALERVRALLNKRHAAHIDEICRTAGVQRDVVRSELQSMLHRGEVERLRPVGYSGDDQDFYRMCGNRPCEDIRRPGLGCVVRNRLRGLFLRASMTHG